jgi:molybdopterin-containing oxidoreductase family iron-sulfur binding subunit
MENSRRRFLKVAGASALGLGLAAGTRSAASEVPDSAGGNAADTPARGDSTASAIPPAQKPVKPKKLPATAKQWAMVIDTRRFQSSKDLAPLIEACNKIHNIPDLAEKRHEIKWIWEEKFHHLFPDHTNKYIPDGVSRRPFPALCNHCKNPPCVKICPTKATFKRKDGIVIMDFHRCIGCRFCMAACPYGARSFNYVDPRPAIKHFNPKFPTRMKGVVEKCNFCAERIAHGKMPACVEASDGAVLFGDLGDPNSDVRLALKHQYTIRRKPSLGTEPSIYYII